MEAFYTESNREDLGLGTQMERFSCHIAHFSRSESSQYIAASPLLLQRVFPSFLGSAFAYGHAIEDARGPYI